MSKKLQKAKGPVVSKVVVPELVCHSCVTWPDPLKAYSLFYGQDGLVYFNKQFLILFYTKL